MKVYNFKIKQKKIEQLKVREKKLYKEGDKEHLSAYTTSEQSINGIIDETFGGIWFKVETTLTTTCLHNSNVLTKFSYLDLK